MELNKVVVKFINGTIMKGHTNDFLPHKKRFHLGQLNGEIIEVDVDQLKAIFFVKDHEGDKNYIKSYNETVPGGGRKIKVTFFDGECITGYTHGYSSDRHGFFITPADLKDNNSRIFVVISSAVNIEFQRASLDEEKAIGNKKTLTMLK